ncbi:MAG: SusC/RagA family TonB-linked outer membrane protein, partial [Pedobacter sp.]
MASLLLVDHAAAQQRRKITGAVVDDQGPISGATITLKGTSVKTQTDQKGEFVIEVTADRQILTIAYLGMKTQDVNVAGKATVKVTLIDNTDQLGEVIVVGYGVQKKQSVVGAITQTTSEVLERTGGVSSLGAALTGNLPGVITTASTGMPGEEDPQILIRG